MHSLFKTALLIASLSASAALAAPAKEYDPQNVDPHTKCASEMEALEVGSVGHSAIYIQVFATTQPTVLKDPMTGYLAFVSPALHDYQQNTESPVWIVIRFEKTPRMLNAVASGMKTPTLQGLRSNLIYVDTDGSCVVSSASADQMESYPTKEVYALATAYAVLMPDGRSGKVTHAISGPRLQMSKQQLIVDIDKSVKRILKLEGKQFGVSYSAPAQPQANISEDSPQEITPEQLSDAVKKSDEDYEKQFHPKKP